MSDLRGRLVDLLVKLVDMPCLTGDEDRIASWLVDRYQLRGEEVRRIANSVVVGQRTDDRPVILLVGHTDVVPPTESDLPARVEHGHVVGRGTSDMKAGLAVAMDLFEDPALRNGPVQLQLVAYAGEEGPHEGNELPQVLAEMPELKDAALAIVLEPTDLEVQLGCMGGLHAEVTLPGRAAHSARPWHGRNALTAAAPLLTELADLEPRDRTVDDLMYRDVITATQAWTSNVRNVVPDRFVINLNYRFAPDKSLADAESELRTMVEHMAGAAVDVRIVDRAPAAPPLRGHPYVRALIAAADDHVTAKQAWTDVAQLAAVGVAALNYGPGLTSQAHQAGEHVPVEHLEQARTVLAAFLATGASRREEVGPDGIQRPTQHI
jgi:succinyl-diaminopimelate desuccinylase